MQHKAEAGFSNIKLKDSKTLRIFFSSPFGGMENEREELTRKYFPRFHHACNARGIQFVPVDMRWGITSEAADNAQVINICLREIDRSDVFIGFFGQRYGWHGESDDLLQQNFDNAVGLYPWLADYRDKSVTELEFLHGHLLHPGQLPASISFRDKAYDDVMKEKAEIDGDLKSAVKYTAESEHSVKLIADLIERVKATESQGAKFMFESVWKYCQELLATSDSVETSFLQQNRLCHDAYLASRTTLYLGGDSYLQELHPLKMKEHPHVLVHGPAGCGKSALLANLVKKIKDSDDKVNFVYHFVGCAQGTTDPKSILQRILAELQHINGTEVKEDLESEHKQSVIDKVNVNEFHDIYVSVQNEMQHSSSDGKHVVIIIDGLDKVTASSKTAKHLYWLPEKFPCGISLIVSSVTSDTETFDLLVTERKFYDLEIMSLPSDIQIEICKETLLTHGKELSPHQLQRVVASEQTRNPLFLKIVLSEISIYGYFRLLDKKIDSLIYSNGVKDLLSKVLQRLEEDYNVQDHPDPLVQQLPLNIKLAQKSRTAKKMLGLTAMSVKDMQLTKKVMFYIHRLPNADRFAFSEFEQAVNEQYLYSTSQRVTVIRQLIEYFDKIRRKNKRTDDFSNPVLKRVASELPWLQKDIQDKWGLIQTLSDLRVLYTLQRKSVYELIDLWSSTGCGQEEICSTLLTAFDVAVGDVYNFNQESGKTAADPPGYTLLKALRAMRDMFSNACYHKAEVKVLERTVKILEGIEGKINEDTRMMLLRENCYHMACSYVNNSEYDRAETLHQSVMLECRNFLKTCEDARVKQTLAFTCNGLGVLHIKQKHYKEAEPLFEESIQLHKELGNTLCVAESIMNLGVISLNSGEPSKALEHFNEAMKRFETIYFGHMPVLVGNLLTNMALCHRRMGDAEKAESLYLRSLEVKANAVGWQNEVIASCYMNLGSLEFYTRKDYAKAENYTRKAIEILELNEVKLEQNEMWQAQENLILMLICQNKWEEALPIFRRVFSMLQRENKVQQGASSVHREMIRYLISKELYQEAANIAECHLNIQSFQLPSVYTLLDFCDRRCDPRPLRPRELTVNFALEELWPGNNELTAYVAQNYVLPSNDLDLLMKMLQTMDDLNPEFTWTTYKVGATWCENLNKLDVAVMVLKEGIQKYPASPELKSRLFDCYRKLHQYTEAYSLLKEVVDHEPDNQAIMLIGGHVALNCDDIDLCQELWEKVIKMPDENLAQMAQKALENLKEQLAALEQESQDPDKKEEQSLVNNL